MKTAASKKLWWIAVWALVAALIWPAAGQAAGEAESLWATFTVEDGLRSGNILSVLVAQDGTLWFGSDAGAGHYDGSWQWLTEADGLPAGRVRAMAQTADAALWFATDAGLARRAADAACCDTWTTGRGLPSDDILTLVAAPQPAEAAGRLSGLFAIGALTYLAARSPARARLLLTLILALAVVQAVFGLFGMAFGLGELLGLPATPGRASGSFVNPNHFAAYVNMGIVVAAVLLLGRLRREIGSPGLLPALARALVTLFERHVVLTAALAILLMASLASGSRGGFVSLVLTLAILVPRELGGGRPLLAVVALFAAAGATILAVAGLPTLERLDQLLPASEFEPGAGGRLAVFGLAIERDAKLRVKGYLLLDAIGTKENIEATPEDVDAALAARAEAEGRKPLAVRAALEKARQWDAFVEEVRFDKIREYLLAKAKIQWVEPKKEEPIQPANE